VNQPNRTDKEFDNSPVPNYVDLQKQHGRNVIVVGAGQGIGRQTAHALAQQGAHVICVDNLSERAEHVAGEVGGTAYMADVLDPGQIRKLIDSVVKERGGIDAVVDIVGMARFTSLVNAEESDWAWQFDIVFKHARLLLKYAAEELAKTGGTFTFVSSIAALTGAQGNGVYAAAKAALVSLVQTAAVELAPTGVRVNSVAPSVVLTPRMRHLLSEERHRNFCDNTPLGRLADPSDVASALLFLTSDHASYITGQTLVLDGGVQARLPYPDFV
jgi:NAD(P)-dependent dehydrogenase (short-subunit alcohol dehydrogenase family)